MKYTILTNTQYNSVEISFDGKPSEATRNALKALKFRWHGVKKVWYGYADEATAKAAIEGNESTEAAPAEQQTKTAQNHIKIYYNGIKIDGGKLIRCGYSLDNNVDHSESVTIYARDYEDLPRDLFEVRNDSDPYTDYFDNDSAVITPGHPLYKYFRYAASKAAARDDVKYCEHLREDLNSGRRELWPGRNDTLKKDLARREAFIKAFEGMTDPGQPTAEDLAEIDRTRQEAENARQEAERAARLAEREKLMYMRVNGGRLIEEEAAAHPIEEGAPVVLINWSEHPAFYNYNDDSLKLSIVAADKILGQLDREQHERDEGYYKTKFTITGTDDLGETFSYAGRYDLGDGEKGLIDHIRSLGEWLRGHDAFGHVKPEPDETNDVIKFAEFLTRYAGAHDLEAGPRLALVG